MTDKTNKICCQFYIVMNDEGAWEVHQEFDSAIDGMEGPIRTVRMAVWMAPAKIEDIEFDIPDDAGSTTQVEAEAAA